MDPSAAIAHQCAARGDGVKRAERIDPILERAGCLGRSTVMRWRMVVSGAQLKREARVALELRPNCEYCDRDLPPNATEARICSYECTFCADCADGI